MTKSKKPIIKKEIKKKMKNTNTLITPLESSGTPAAIGPYSKGVKVDMGTVFMYYSSGSLGVDPKSKTGDLFEGVKAQTEQSLKNLQNLLEENGATFNNVVKTMVFVAVKILLFLFKFLVNG